MCFVAVSMVFTSCAKNEDLIIGKWNCVKVVTDGQTYTDGDQVGFTYEFTADNKVTMGMNGFEIAGTYAIDGDVLTITIVGQSDKMNIDKLTKSKMILSDPDNAENIAEFEKM